jgi:uncharacterized Rmd1/YagE family protein
MHSFARHISTPSIRQSLISSSKLRTFRHLHAAAVYQSPRKRAFFSSNAALQQEGSVGKGVTIKDVLPPQKKKNIRSTAGKTSLRRVAVEAQRSRETASPKKEPSTGADGIKSVTAMSMADQFDMDEVIRILRSHGFPVDPDGTGFDSDQVIHTRGVNNGDIFVFPSGTMVAWSLPEDVVSDLATKTLLPAARTPHMDQIETENLEYTEDVTKENSNIRGDVITLGTKSVLQVEEASR